jgi:uncharacterized coiled-coil protein SlyX
MVRDMDETAVSSTTNPSEPELELDSVRTILLAPEQQRIAKLEAEVAQLHALLKAANEQIAAQEQALADLREEFTTANEALIPSLMQQLTKMISETIRASRDQMAEALGPVMGDAIRVQVRDSRPEMVDALYPVILETVTRAIAEFAREFQRNIDQRLKATFGPQGFLRRVTARLRGVSAGELALRDALPFGINELFLIQHQSGLLMAHTAVNAEPDDDSDLIGGMLTAIRSFVQDSFGDGSQEHELDEIQYGDQRIIIQSGQYVYLAAVITGIEPEGFRTKLRQFISELHTAYKPKLRDYNGDPTGMPDLTAALAELAAELEQISN